MIDIRYLDGALSYYMINGDGLMACQYIHIRPNYW